MESDDSRSEGLGRAIRVIRSGLDMSRKELAQRSGLSYSYLAEIEGGAKTPSSKALAQLAEALGVAVHELMEAAQRWERTPPPHSFEELRDATTRRQDLSFASPPAAARGLGRASVRKRLLGLRNRLVADEAAESPDLGDGARSAFAEDAARGSRGVATDVAELLELLKALEPEDRERVLDLARRLADEA
ncbi:MAG: helix-turn-helix domain-containing protein [Myxococcota bacterium]